MSAVLLRERKQKELFQKHGQNSASKHLIVETEENDKVAKKAEINGHRNRVFNTYALLQRGVFG